MFRNLLVPLDGSPMAESALEAAAYLAPKLGADVTLIHCLERAAPETVHGERHLREPQEARAYLEEAAARAFPPAAGAQARAKVACHTHAPEVADVASSILEHAKEMPSTLIVMCTHGRSGVGNLLFGNIAQRIIGGGTAPVLLMPPSAAPALRSLPAAAAGGGEPAKEGEHKFACRRLLVPLDGDPAHEQALTVAGDLAAACQSEMHLVFVVPTPRSLPGSDAAVGLLLPHATRAVLEIARKEAEAYLSRHVQCQLARQQGALARLGGEAPGRSVTSEVCRGDAAKAISRAARRARADLIVMATHRREAMDAFWSGSVAPRVASYARRPLLLVPIAE